MNEWELEEIEKRAEELEAENSTYGQVHDLGEETHALCLDTQRLIGEVRRSHAEAAELRERVEQLESIGTRLIQGCENAPFDPTLYTAVKELRTALSPKQENQEEEG